MSGFVPVDPSHPDRTVDWSKKHLKEFARTAKWKRVGGVRARMFRYRGVEIIGEQFYIPVGARNDCEHVLHVSCWCRPEVEIGEFGTMITHHDAVIHH